MERFAAKKPTCVQFDDKLQFYRNLAIEVQQLVIPLAFIVKKLCVSNIDYHVTALGSHKKSLT